MHHKSELLPLSQGQTSIWLAQMLDLRDPAFNVGECVEICGAIDKDLFEQALRRLVKEADALRLRVLETDDGPRQYYGDDDDWVMPFLDLSADGDPRAAAEAWMRLDMTRAFNLAEGPLFRFALLRVSADCYFWYAANHHIVNDGFGALILLRRVAELYSDLAGDRPADSESITSHAYLLEAERNYRQAEHFSRDRDYWLNILKDRPVAATLSTGPVSPNPGVIQITGWIPRAVDLESFGRTYGSSGAAAILAGVALYLYRMTGARDLVLGMNVAARIGDHPRRAVGLAANIVPLRLSIDPDESFDSLLRRTARKLRDAFRHQLYRTEDLRRDLGLAPHDSSIYCAFANYIPLDESSRFSEFAIRRRPLGNWREDDIQFVYYGGSASCGHRIDIVANAAKYTPDQLEEHQKRFSALLSQCVAKPDTICSGADIISAAERAKILVEFNAVGKDYSTDKLIHQLFEEQVKANPEAIALYFDKATLTYESLNVRANKLARCLRANGVAPETLVAVCLEISVNVVVALLGIMKAGGACVPIDPALPKDRIASVLGDANPLVILTEDRARSRLPDTQSKLIVLDLEDDIIARFAGTNLDAEAPALTPRCLAYVDYTSSFTGVPKGVMNEHRGIVNRLQWMQDEYRLTSDDCVLQKTPLGFDGSVREVLWPLMAGARLAVARPREQLDPAYLKRLILEIGVTTIHFFPSMLPAFLDFEGIEECKSLRRIFCNGEELSPALASRCLARLPETRLYNLCGPTEAAIDVTHWTCLPGDSTGRVPIGRPVANNQIYIVDPLMQPVPIGAVGEICIGGVGLARGYLRQPELTAQRFVSSPFNQDDPNAKLYKTGDLGRWRSDGAVEYLGRNDLQVKIRGACIELNEIELKLTRIPGIREAAVIVCEDPESRPQLVAYFTEDAPKPASSSEQAPADIETIRRELSLTLADQMVPAAFVPLAAIPLTADGKPDRKALVAMGWPGGADAAGVDTSPQGASERALQAIWREVLRVDHFGRFDDFFDLGGHSLLATQVASRISRTFGLELPLHVIFDARTLESLGRRVDDALSENSQVAIAPIIQYQALQDAGGRVGRAPGGNKKTATAPPIEPIPGESESALSYSQQRMWLIQSLDPQNTAYNLSGTVRLLGPLDARAFSGALNELCRRHENLRSTFFEGDGEVKQQVNAWQHQELVVTDLRSFGDDASKEAQQRAEGDARTPIDLGRGPVMRVSLFRIAAQEHVLQITLHHISGDQWSVGIIGRELAAAYNALRAGQPVSLEPISIHYRDYALWQRRYLNDSRTESQLSYWTEKLRELPSLELPTDFPRPRVRGLNGASHLTSITPSLLSRLEQLSRREGCTLFMTMLAAFALQLYRLTGQDDFAIGAPIANRTRSDVENMVGTFVNTLALRIDLSGKPGFRDFLKRVRATALDAYANQDVPFDKLVQDIKQARDNSRAPLAQVMFNMLNAPFHGVSFDGLKWEPVVIDRGGAQFELSVSVDAQLSNTVTFEYNTDLFERATIERFAAQYFQILESITDDPTLTVASVPMLPSDERRLLLHDWNATRTNDVDRPLFVSMFEQQAARHPGAPAISFEDQTISYAALNASANTVARNLREMGVRSNTGVAICMKRSIDLVVMLLGIQKAGAYYVPLDPSFPAKRLSYMLDDSGVYALVTDADSKALLTTPTGLHVFDSAALVAASNASAQGNLDGGASPSDIAYIIYTSGSTGQPKGVAVQHGSLSNFLLSMSRSPGLSSRDVLAAVTTISFDIAGLELYLPLSVGARIELVSKETASNAADLSRLLAGNGATVLQATPATWRMLIEGGWKGSTNLRALCGGEPLSRDLADEVLARVAELWNLYGPTETTIWSAAARIEPGKAPISIGRPIENTRIYVTDREGELSPIGIPGEILIAGDGVASGYHGRPEVTADRFLSDRFAPNGGGRLYRTGDLGKWGADGVLYHLGRIDNQVKVRGFRIEVGEIEAILRQHPSVAQAVVVARELSPGDSRLVAYVVYTGEEATVSELRSHLRLYLPDYMVPALIVAIDEVPLTPNGKINAKALPDPFASQTQLTGEYVAPAPGIEEMIADIWRDLLKVRNVSADDNFFELGGHSLLAVKVAAMVRKRTGRRLDPRTLYFQNLRQIAEVVIQERV